MWQILEKVKKISIKDCLCIMIIIVYGVALIINAGIHDSDYYWEVATGRDILKNGIHNYNPLFVKEGVPVVEQQWLYCVYLAFIDQLGGVGIFLTVTLFFLLNVAAEYNYFKLNGGDKLLSIVFSLFIPIACCSTYIYGTRPETLTLMLLIFQLYLQEYASVNKKPKVLFIIPLLTLIEINVHASMWIMHFLIFVPYYIPVFKGLSNSSDPRMRLEEKNIFIITSLTLGLMICSLLINPYGIDMVMYSFKALTSDLFRLCTIQELQPIELSLITETNDYGKQINMPFVAWLALLVVFVISIVKRKLKSSDIYICGGLLSFCFVVDSIRNVQFLPIVGVILLVNIIKTIQNNQFINNNAPSVMKVMSFMISGVSFIACIVMMINGFAASTATKSLVVKEGTKLVDEFVEITGGETANVFTNPDLGGILEYYGYKSFMDGRPELYDVELTDERNPLLDWLYLYDEPGYKSTVYWNNSEKKVSTIDIYKLWKEVKEYYELDYVVVPIKMESNIGRIVAEHENEFEFMCKNDYFTIHKIVITQ